MPHPIFSGNRPLHSFQDPGLLAETIHLPLIGASKQKPEHLFQASTRATTIHIEQIYPETSAVRLPSDASAALP
jgi:hypothetical protein